MLTKSTTLKFYKQKAIQDAMVEHAQRKEVGVRYNEAFGKRPDTLLYPREVLELALRNATSFHCSEELWENPTALSSELSRKELDELRVGWDLVLDIDCKFLEYSKICTDIIIKFLKYCRVKDISVKFSGNKGFHIGVPFEAFPQQVGSTLTKDLFPDAPKKIAFYVKENIKGELGRRILQFEQNNFAAVKEKVGLAQEEITRFDRNEFGDNIPQLNVDRFLEIDTVLISPRHLYRMPYSLHEKSGLVSIPLDPEKVMDFDKPQANPDLVTITGFRFMDRRVQGESARQLLVQALDFDVKMEEEPEKQARQYEEMTIECPITEEFFPPCMLTMLKGMEDGKKRAVFCLMNYLGKIGWSKPEIEVYLRKWNTEKNPVPLREVYIKGQLNHFKAGERLPPNCDNDAYYKSMGLVCNSDGHCKRYKNPLNYTLSKWRRRMRAKEEEKKSPS